MAYFQPATNTYAPVDELRALYDIPLEYPEVVAMAIGTRPDCVPDDVLDLLQEFGERTYLTVEYGLQTVHNRSLDWDEPRTSSRRFFGGDGAERWSRF